MRWAASHSVGGTKWNSEPSGSTIVPDKARAQVGDLTALPPPVSHIVGRGTKKQLTDRGKSILHAIHAPVAGKGSHCLSRRETILRALMDDTYA